MRTTIAGAGLAALGGILAAVGAPHDAWLALISGGLGILGVSRLSS
jgi:hypothetical protein